MKKASVLKAALALCTEAEAEAVWEALAQFVENGKDYIAQNDEPVPEAAQIAAGEALLDKMNSAVVALASDVEPVKPSAVHSCQYGCGFQSFHLSMLTLHENECSSKPGNA